MNRIYEFFHRSGQLISQSFEAVFGAISWRKPHWLTRGSDAIENRLRFGILLAVTLLLLAAIGGGGLYAWIVWTRPAGNVTVSIKPPAVSPVVEGKIVPQPLVVDFSQSCALLDQINKKITRGVEIRPSTPGTWIWTNDKQLTFQPSRDWPAQTRYTIVFERSLFPGHVQLNTYRPQFETEKFKAQFEVSEFYVNPKDPGTKQVTATLNFTHPVDEKELTSHLEMKWLGKEDLFQYPGKNAPLFKVTMGPVNRTAYIRSLPIKLPENDTFLKVILKKGLKDAAGSGWFDEGLEQEVRIPTIFSFLRFEDVSTSVAQRTDGEPEQVLVMQSAIGVKPDELKKAITVQLLPKDRPARGKEKAIKDYEWSGVGELDDKLLAQSPRLDVAVNPSQEEFPSTHSLKFSAPENRYLYVKVHGGFTGLGGFVMHNDYETIVKVVPYPKELRILHNGAILALSGERKLSILSRSLKKLEFRVGRIAPREINHLISQSSGNFQSPVFQNYSFGEDNICETLAKTVEVAASPGKPSYQNLDFNDYLTDKRTGEHRGLFIVRVSETKPKVKKTEDDSEPEAGDEAESNESNESWTSQNSSRWDDREEGEGIVYDRRLILVTDLGIVAKQNADSSQEVFVQSIKTGLPMANVSVGVLGKNGLLVATASTDNDGHASLPALKDFKREKEPVAIVVRQGEDLSFMPYNRADRRLNFSRYDISGLTLPRSDVVDAFVFSDRGIYRPGDTVHIGAALKQMDWKGNLAGVPVDVIVTDPHGITRSEQHLKTPAGGFFEWQFSLAENSPTGVYTAGVYLVKNDKRSDLVGSAIIRVEEFLPDRMKIKAALSNNPDKGWANPKDLKIHVDLTNLYGAQAIGHRVNAKISLTPAAVSFDRYPDFTFFDPLLKDAVRREAHEEELPDSTTDEHGSAALDLNLSRFDQSAYRLAYVVKGFEKEGGRSVSIGGEALVTARPWLMGFKADGDLNYINRESKHQVEFLAVDSQLKPYAAGNLKLVLSEQFYISVLTKKPDGNYAYQSVLKEREVKTETLQFTDKGSTWTAPTADAGDYVARIYDADNLCVSVVRFNVVGAGNLTKQLERNAELKAKISKVEFQPGEEISIAITAPYTGSGLITIERDRVYAHAWFTAKSLSSVQKITIPKDFEGNGYLNVAFVRALDSHEIFMSPLSYAVIPFRVNRGARTVEIELNTPEKVVPGENMAIQFHGNRPAKIVVYAVDEGILQVASYLLPNPLDHFLQKRALQVTTDQILDMILPEYSISREVSAAGGDGGEDLAALNLNPFKRKNEAPVVFWSGVIDCDQKLREVTYKIPDYFNGTLRVMAVAVSDTAAGAAEKKVVSRGPFVIQPNVPTFVAPGDVFDVSVTVANNIEGSGPDAHIEFETAESDALEILQRPAQPLAIAEGQDVVAHVVCRAKDVLGNADLNFTAKQGAISAHYASHLSVRPPSAYRTEIKSGYFAGNSADVSLPRNLYPAYFKGLVSASMLPFGLSKGLETYLVDYPHLCSEQLTSKGLAQVTMAGEDGTDVTKIEAENTFRDVCMVLRARQNDQGAFGLWKAEKVEPFDFTSLYVMQFLTEAKDRDFDVMSDMLQSGLNYLTKTAEGTPNNIQQARNQALAIYLLARNKIVATNYLDRLRDHLEQNYPKIWKNDLAAVYCAGTYAELRNMREGERIIADFKMEQRTKPADYDFYTDLGRDSQYLTIVARHFPEQLRRVSAEDLLQIINPIIDNQYNTFSAAYAILGLQAYSKAISGSEMPTLNIQTRAANGEWQKLAVTATSAPSGMLDVNARHVRFERGQNAAPGKIPNVFYQVVQGGFDRSLPDKAIVQGLEVQREYRNARGEVVNHAALGEEVEVHVKVRSVDRDFVDNAAIIDLIPGGFEVAMDSIRNGPKSGNELLIPDFVDVREDRVIIYGTVCRSAKEFVYRMKAVNKGQFIVPPVQAESMYNPRLLSCGTGGQFVIGDK